MLTCWLQSWCQQFQFNLKIQSAIWTPATHILAGLSEPGGQGDTYPHIWADQVTLSQPGGHYYVPRRIFRPSPGPV